jgi:catechol 2,3-dioxygenase-like lactoylglutathione lyase family enzyme
MQGPMLAPHAVLESSLYVSDLERSMAFYRNVLGLRQMTEFAPRGVAMQVGPSVLLLFRADETRKGGDFLPHGTDGQGHVAFRIEPEEIGAWRKRLTEQGVSIEREIVFGDNPPSIYFRDPDGNSVELAVATIWPLERP